ncbi:TipAS antibiotic-recognition domain-containing protein [Paenibacillus senegalensis]|uniref:TipAS antibiotic-recognition domain-containing protein n=1 Tax=Paenibacillus senegalensis TaxID=1465766 RepID=UPI00031F0EE4|nr:TipAS antibiotic-recognition domain-containing protein [Paenibacillus senegalensis]
MTLPLGWGLSIDDAAVEELDESAKEAQEFMGKMTFALQEGWSVDDQSIQQLVADHIRYINDKIMTLDAKGFVESAWFFITDEFHKTILEEQQIGLTYYLYAAAVHHAQ